MTTGESPSKKGKKLQIEKLLENGFEIILYRKHNDNSNYTVKLAKGDIEQVFTNVAPTHMCALLKVEMENLKNEWDRGTEAIKAEKVGKQLLQATEEKWEVRGYKKHSSNTCYTVWMNRDDVFKTFPNVSKSHLAIALSKEESELEDHWGHTDQSSARSRANSLAGCIERGAVLSEVKENENEFFTVKMKSPDGATFTFPHVSAQTLSNTPGYNEFIAGK